MTRGLALASFAAVLALASLAAADALPDCPPGTHFVGNPIPEGAMHHSGGQCVPDDEGGGEPEAAEPAAPAATPPAAEPATEERAAPASTAEAPAEQDESGGCAVRPTHGAALPLLLAGLIAGVLWRRHR